MVRANDCLRKGNEVVRYSLARELTAFPPNCCWLYELPPCIERNVAVDLSLLNEWEVFFD